MPSIWALVFEAASPYTRAALRSPPAGVPLVSLGTAILAALLSGCETSIYYPNDLPPPEGWVSACDGKVAATVVVQNDGETAVEVQELQPGDRCNPSVRGTVDPGETVDMGKADSPIWRIEDAETGEWLGTFTLADGENLLQVP